MNTRVTKRRLAVAALVALQGLVATEVLTTAALFGLQSAQAGQNPSQLSLPRDVPRQIHMFWAGEKLRPEELANVRDWGRIAGSQNPNGEGSSSAGPNKLRKNTAYDVTLWTTPDTLKKLKASGQYEDLR
ncbi:MAG TPA: hypothetical protein VIV60_01390, partial [Polyangiaceae bacterium]